MQDITGKVDFKLQAEALTKTVDAYMVKVSEQQEEIERLRDKNKELKSGLETIINVLRGNTEYAPDEINISYCLKLIESK